MRSSAEVSAALDSALDAIVQAVERSPTAVVLIDGRSGSGKSTLAQAVAQACDAQLLALDSVYPGWDGLAAGAEMVYRDVLLPFSAGRPGTWRRWDWRAECSAETHVVAPNRPLVVEGVGILTARSAPLAQARVWLESPARSRRERALRRDGDAYRPHWAQWAAQEREHIKMNRPRSLANIRVDVP